MTAGWTSSDLGEIAGQEEIRISSERSGGGFSRWTPIWVVRVARASRLTWLQVLESAPMYGWITSETMPLIIQPDDPATTRLAMIR
jgi:hypothetical protein